MTATNHAVTGALIVLSIDNPIIGLPLAFLSHFALDILPQWDHKVTPHLQRAVDIGDVLLAGVLTLAIALVLPEDMLLVMAGAFFAAVPDAMWLPEKAQGRKVKLKGSGWIFRMRRWHAKIQWGEYSHGWALEILWFVIIFNLIFLPL